MEAKDSLNRPVRDLRISVTDRCNFRCGYCMPKEIFGRDYEFMPHDDLLSFEEIEKVAKSFVRLGVLYVYIVCVYCMCVLYVNIVRFYGVVLYVYIV